MPFPKLGKYEQVFLLLLFIVIVFSKCIAPYFQKVEIPLPVTPISAPSPAAPVSESDTPTPSPGIAGASYPVAPVASVIPTDQEIAVAIEDQKQKKERLETVTADRKQRIEKVRASAAASKTSQVDPQEDSNKSKESDLSSGKDAMTQEEMKQMNPSRGYYMH
jgi:hypothetical protein